MVAQYCECTKLLTFNDQFMLFKFHLSKNVTNKKKDVDAVLGDLD